MFNKPELMGPLVLALLAGAVIPFQAAANATLGRLLGHPLWGALISLMVSLAVVLPSLMMLRVPAPKLAAVVHGPWWLWVGGVLGALYVAAAASLIPKLGAGSFIVCVVAGQMVIAVLIDHFGVMGLAAKPINIYRFAGIALILGGVFLIQGLGARGLLPSSASSVPAHP